MKLFEGLDSLNGPSKYWALSDHMIFYFIIVPIGVAVVAVLVVISPVLFVCLISGVWGDDYD